MEDWNKAASGGMTKIGQCCCSPHGYFSGNVTAIRTAAGCSLILAAVKAQARCLRQYVAGMMPRCIRSSLPMATLITHGVQRLFDQEADKRVCAPAHHRAPDVSTLPAFATHGLSSLVMGRQFSQPGYIFPEDHRRPDQIYDEL